MYAPTDRFCSPATRPKPKKRRFRPIATLAQSYDTAMATNESPTKSAVAVVVSLIAVAAFAIGGPVFVIDRIEDRVRQEAGATNRRLDEIEKAVQHNTRTLEGANLGDRWTRTNMDHYMQLFHARNPDLIVPEVK